MPHVASIGGMSLVAWAVAFGGGLGGVGSPALGQVEALRTTRVAFGLNLPIYATHPPGDTERLFIVEKAGKVRILDLDTQTVLATPFLDIDAQVITPSGSVSAQENFGKGIMGMAFDPGYAVNGHFYLHYYRNDTDGVIARFTVTAADPNVADPATEFVVWTWDDANNDHNGGSIDFGPDGFLFITLGDGGTQQDPENDAQNVNSMFGKIHRIDVHGPDAFPADPNRNFAVPPGNPFAAGGGVASILHWGLRNPYRASFDSGTGRYYIGDVGQTAREEISVAAPGATGLNFGWKCTEGTMCTAFGTTACTCGSPALTPPIHDYVWGSTGRSVIGGYVYRGCDIPSLQGTYLFADYTSNNIWRLSYDGATATAVTLLNSQLSTTVEGLPVQKIASFAEDGRGELYLIRHAKTTSIEGEVYKIIPAKPTIVAQDLNCDGIVNGLDLASLLAQWGRCQPFSCPGDLDGSGTVNGLDLAALLAVWG
jgi:glucose/arabinose dehydrogenase